MARCWIKAADIGEHVRATDSPLTPPENVENPGKGETLPYSEERTSVGASLIGTALYDSHLKLRYLLESGDGMIPNVLVCRVTMLPD